MEMIGLFGGSFDPVHLGHLLVAQAAREEMGLDRLVFIPAAQSPFKPENRPARAEDRLRLLRLAMAGKPWCEVDDFEVAKGGVSFTIETVRHYRRLYPDAQLHYLVGADIVPQLPLWREADELARLLVFVAVPRPGEPSTVFPSPFTGRTLSGFPLRVSSSEIRTRIREGKTIDHLVPEAVSEAIRNSGLYL